MDQVDDKPGQEPFTFVEHMPIAPYNLTEYINTNLKYPKTAKKNEIMGRVYTQFIVGVDGKMKDVMVQKGIGYGCDEEALLAVKNMPRWNPGIMAGKPVKVRIVLPILFKLAASAKPSSIPLKPIDQK